MCTSKICLVGKGNAPDPVRLPVLLFHLCTLDKYIQLSCNHCLVLSAEVQHYGDHYTFVLHPTQGFLAVDDAVIVR